MKRIIALALLSALLIGGVTLCYRAEIMVSTYATHADAVADGAVVRGWMPAYVPPSARDIREVHNIDTNQQWLRLRLPAHDARAMVGAMEPVPESEAPRRSPEPPRWSGRWLPAPDGAASTGPRAPLAFYRDPTPESNAPCVAVEWTEPATVFAWSC